LDAFLFETFAKPLQIMQHQTLKSRAKSSRHDLSINSR
jgi:hypothetical protein